jgi:hypothetical protein
MPNISFEKDAYSATPHSHLSSWALLPDASRRQQQAADFIHWPFGAKRLTTSGFSRQAR